MSRRLPYWPDQGECTILSLCLSPLLLPFLDFCRLVCAGSQTWGREALIVLQVLPQLVGLAWAPLPLGLSWEVHLLGNHRIPAFLPESFLMTLTSVLKANYRIPLLFLDLCFTDQPGWGHSHSLLFHLWTAPNCLHLHFLS